MLPEVAKMTKMFKMQKKPKKHQNDQNPKNPQNGQKGPPGASKMTKNHDFDLPKSRKSTTKLLVFCTLVFRTS